MAGSCTPITLCRSARAAIGTTWPTVRLGALRVMRGRQTLNDAGEIEKVENHTDLA